MVVKVTMTGLSCNNRKVVTALFETLLYAETLFSYDFESAW
jgi:hypothetical protein